MYRDDAEKIKETNDIRDVEAAQDRLELLKLIRGVSNNFESTKFLPYAIFIGRAPVGKL
jgi:hypothetical protein